MSDKENCDTHNSQETVSAEWLEDILTTHHNEKVTVKDFSKKFHHDSSITLSDIEALQVNYDLPNQENQTISLIVKLLPIDQFSRNFVTQAQFDLREIKFYTQVVPDMMEFQKNCLPPDALPIKLPIPCCYHANQGLSQLVLADVRADGYERAEFMDGLSLKQAISALDAVSRLHALSLTMKIKEDVDLNEKYPFLFQTDQATDSYQQLVERGLCLLADFLKDKPEQIPAMECLKEIHPKLKDVITALLTPEEPLKLITHTDFWCNNLMFNDNDDCCILDWQMVTCSRPTNDIALLIISSLPTSLRRTETPHLLDVYWTKFTNYSSTLGINVEENLNYSREKLEEDYKKSQLLAILLCIGSLDLAMGNTMTEQRVLDLLQDLYEDGIFNLE